MTDLAYRFHNEDNDNCRVYYRATTGGLFCYQMDTPDAFTFYRCTRDGEPSHPVTPGATVPPPPGETKTGEQLKAFLISANAKTENAAIVARLAASLAHYVSPEDLMLPRDNFLATVASRIGDDLEGVEVGGLPQLFEAWAKAATAAGFVQHADGDWYKPDASIPDTQWKWYDDAEEVVAREGLDMGTAGKGE